MKIICFKGISRTGKSTTIKKILNEFFNITLIPEEKKDFCLRLLYGDKNVGICSYGDDINAINKGLKPLRQCDIIICACRTSGVVFDFVNNELGGEVNYIECERVQEESNQNRVLNDRVSNFRRLFETFLQE